MNDVGVEIAIEGTKSIETGIQSSDVSLLFMLLTLSVIVLTIASLTVMKKCKKLP